MSVFVVERRVTFGDCDPARIAYTGRIADFALDALDAFWDDLMDGKGWFHMTAHRGFAMPFVKMEYDFAAPITAGSVVQCLVRPDRIGTTSATLTVEGRQAGRSCFHARFVSVFVSLDRIRKIEVPEDIRAAMLGRFPELRAG